MNTNEARTEPRTNQHMYGERAFWVKGEEAEKAKGKNLTVILRMGDRSDRERAPKQWLPLFQPIPIYCIAVPGDQEKGISAQFEPDQGLTAQVVRRTVTRLGDITGGDLFFGNGHAIPLRATDVADYLAENFAGGKVLPPDTVMTVYWVEYLPDETPATD